MELDVQFKVRDSDRGDVCSTVASSSFSSS